jgi:hypothetical protein
MNAATAVPPIRATGILLSNLLIAVFGTEIVADTVMRYIHTFQPLPSETAMLKADTVSAVFAFGLGFSVYLRWRPAVSKWLWLAGLVWYVPRALTTLNVNHESVFGGPSEPPIALHSLADWARFTLSCIRTIFYSTGAFCGSWWLSSGVG